jgi:uncharacterized protein YjgD (DUF1641 family)
MAQLRLNRTEDLEEKLAKLRTLYGTSRDSDVIRHLIDEAYKDFMLHLMSVDTTTYLTSTKANKKALDQSIREYQAGTIVQKELTEE